MGRKIPPGALCLTLSNWEVVEAYQRWDGTHAGLVALEGRYGVSWKTLGRAFRRARETYQRMREDDTNGQP